MSQEHGSTAFAVYSWKDLKRVVGGLGKKTLDLPIGDWLRTL